MTILSLTDKTRLIIAILKLQPKQARFLDLLLEHEYVDGDLLINEGVAPNDNTIRCQASILRKYLKKMSVPLFNVRETGYWIAPDNKEKINGRLL